MKILCCSPLFFEYRLPFYKELNRLFGGSFHVLYSPLRYRLRKKELLEEKIRREMGKNAHAHLTEHIFDTATCRWDVSYDPAIGKRIPLVWGLQKSIARIRPDVLFTIGYFQWTPYVLLYGILHRIPVYMGYERTLHNERNCSRLKLWQRKLFNRFFAGYLVNGSETRKYLESLGVPSEKIHIAGMSADSEHMRNGVEEFRRSGERNAFRESILGATRAESICFLFTGDVSAHKGIIQLLEAWKVHLAVHPHDHLVVIGDGNKMEESRQLCRDMPSVHLQGRVPYADVPKYYAIADVNILPTLSDNWSLVIPEAMSCGLPVATSIYNGCHPELIHEGINGYKFDTLKQESIVEALHKFHSADLEAMGKASVEIEKPFNTENSARRVYEAIMKDMQQK